MPTKHIIQNVKKTNNKNLKKNNKINQTILIYNIYKKHNKKNRYISKSI